MKIRLIGEGLTLEALLNGSETAIALATRMPFEVRLARWGEEYYGDIGDPLSMALAPDARVEMEIGELAYWPPGNALCVFFGPTPASEGDEPRAASPVNPVGFLKGDWQGLARLGNAITLTVESAE